MAQHGMTRDEMTQDLLEERHLHDARGVHIPGVRHAQNRQIARIQLRVHPPDERAPGLDGAPPRARAVPRLGGAQGALGRGRAAGGVTITISSRINLVDCSAWRGERQGGEERGMRRREVRSGVRGPLTKG